ncbi:HD domain-containing protein [Bacteroidota bacterium]
MDIQSLYQKALTFAATKHMEKGQTVPGTDLPYTVHLSNVAMEILVAGSNTPDFNTTFAVQVALLHDTLEDTSTTYEELRERFGTDIADAVQALSKNQDLPKEEQMDDSIQRIKKTPKEVWAVKLADRITNLQPPPTYWSKAKRIEYQEESRIILAELKEANKHLAQRVEKKIEKYSDYMRNMDISPDNST